MSHLAQHHTGVKLPAVIDLSWWLDEHGQLTPGSIRGADEARTWLERAAADTVAVDDSVQAAYESGEKYFVAVFQTRFGEWIDQAYRSGMLVGAGYNFCTRDGGLRESFLRHAARSAYATLQFAVVIAAA